MASSLQVAEQVLALARQEIEPEFPTHLQLQKLLYYVQGWTIALSGDVAFGSNIEAWQHGPVVCDLYPTFAGYGRNPIVEYRSTAANLDAITKFYTVLVWDRYKRYSASALRGKTHKERPWIDARKGLGPSDKCSNVISVESMKMFFSSESKDRDRFELKMKSMPNWSSCEDAKLVGIAQKLFIKRDSLLDRLSK